MFSASYSAGLSGIEGFPVTVECNQRNNLEGFEVVGLPDAAVKEAKERVRTACVNSRGITVGIAISNNIKLRAIRNNVWINRYTADISRHTCSS